MIPFDLKIDKNGLLYIDEHSIINRDVLLLDKRDNKHEY